MFQSYGFSDGTIALLATGVTGSVFLVSTLPAMVSDRSNVKIPSKRLSNIMQQFLIDKLGRKSMLMTGSIVMFVCMVTVGIIVAKFRHDWPHHTDAGWAAVVLIWIYIGAFGYGWGPASWVLVSEVFPLSVRRLQSSLNVPV